MWRRRRRQWRRRRRRRLHSAATLPLLLSTHVAYAKTTWLTEEVPDGVEVLGYLVVAAACLYCSYLAYRYCCEAYICNRLRSLEAQVCYLCGGVAAGPSWCSGAHRLECIAKNKEEFERNPLQAGGFRCPTCADDMRLWTLRKGPPFNCHLGDNCSGGLFGKEMDNDGNNRFVCFRCDYNLCRPCYEGNLVFEALEDVEEDVDPGSAAALTSVPEAADSNAELAGEELVFVVKKENSGGSIPKESRFTIPVLGESSHI